MYTVYHNGVKHLDFECQRNARNEAWAVCRRGGGESEVRQGEQRITGFRALVVSKTGWTVEEIS